MSFLFLASRFGRPAKLIGVFILLTALRIESEFASVALEINQWTSGSCAPNSWKDYRLELDYATSKNNLIFQIRDKATQLRIDRLDVHVVEDTIPVHRESLGEGTGYAIGNIYTRSISYYDLQPKTYFLLLRCKDNAVDFEIRPEVAVSILQTGLSTSVEICPDDLLHHKILVNEEFVPEMYNGTIQGPHNLKVSVSTDHSDIIVQPAHGHPPLFLVPPYMQVSAGESNGAASHLPSELNLCDLHTDELAYIGIFGSGKHCTNYIISLEYFSGEECSELDVHMDSATLSQTAASIPLKMDHFQHGFTAAFQTTDYYVEVPEGKDGNLEFIIEDLSVGTNPESLTAKLFYGSIPVERHSEEYTSRSVDGLYSIVMSSYDVKAGTYFLSVTAGSVDVRYKIIALDVRSLLHPSLPPVHGEACNGNILFHYYNVPENNLDVANVRIEIEVHGGNFFYYTAHGHPPLKMIPPYQFADYSKLNGQQVTFDFCNMEPGDHYVAIKGGDVCSNYEISVRELESAESCHEIQHICNDDCLTHCTSLEPEHMIKDSCDPGETKKYMLSIDEAHASSNFEIQVLDRTDRLMPRSLMVQHFKGGFTEDYMSPLFTDIAPSGTFAISVSSWDLQADNHFILVTCNPSTRVEYSLLTHLSPAQMVPHELRHGDICPGSWFHYHVDLDSSGHALSTEGSTSGHRRLAAASSTAHGEVVGHVKFRVWIHVGSLNILTKQSSPPLKVIPPYFTSSAAEQLFGGHGLAPKEIWHCNATEGSVYIALQGVAECASFEIDAEVYPASQGLPYECGGETVPALRAESASAAASSSAPGLAGASTGLSQGATNLISSLDGISFGHYTLGSCKPGSYVGYHMHVDASHANKYNLIITMEDLTDTDSVSALSLLLYKDDVPANRHTEHATAASAGGLYSIAISAWDLEEGHYFVYVQCMAEARNFKVLADIHSKMEIVEEEAVTGTVCPGEIMLHSILTPVDGSASQLHWDITTFTGDVYIMLAHDHPQLRLVPPYNHLYASSSHTNVTTSTVSTCHIQTGSISQYITVRGGDTCADYQVRPSFKSRSDCSTIQHEPKTNIGDSDIQMWHFHYDSCEEDAIRDMRLHIDENDGGKNLEILVQDLGTDKLVTDSLAVYLYQGNIPLDRKTERFSDYSNERMFALGVNAHDLVGNVDYFLSVKCNRARGRFRVLAMLVNAQLEAGHAVHGEICPLNWMHHYYDTTHLKLGLSVGSNNTGHRRLSTAGQGGSATHLRFTVDVFTGDHYYQMRPSRAPISLAPPFRWADAAGSKPYGQLVNGRGQFIANFCNVEDSDAEKIYFTLRGGRKCAVYELAVEEWTGEGCMDMEHDTAINTGVQADLLTPHHVTHGSCEAGNWKDYYFVLTHEDEHKNVAVTVEDLTNTDNPEALTVHMYKGSEKVPSPRKADIEVKESKNGLYSMGIDEVHVHAGNYIVSVRCTQGFTRHRVALELVEVEILEHQSVGGYIIPGGWTYHFFQAPMSMPHFRFETTVFAGHVYLMSARQVYPPSFVTLANNSFTRILDPVDGAPITYSVTICDAANEKHYIGMYGGDAVADYVTKVVVIHDAESCNVEGLDGYQSLAYRATSSAFRTPLPAQTLTSSGMMLLLCVASIFVLIVTAHI